MYSPTLSILLKESSYMSGSTKLFHELVLDLAAFSMYLLELMSIAIIVFTTVVAFVKLFRHERYARVYLLHGQSLGLTFKLGAEILRTITATSLMDIIEVFLLIVIKACMVLLIERELKSTDETDITDPSHMSKTPHAQHQKPKASEAGKFRFSMFHTETQLAPGSHEAEHLQQEIDELRDELHQKQEEVQELQSASSDSSTAADQKV